MFKNNQRQLISDDENLDDINSNEVVGIIVEYSKKEDIKMIETIPKASYMVVDESYAIVYIPFNEIKNIKSYVRVIYGINNQEIYTLNEVTPIEASNVPMFNVNPYLNLTGKGVIIGIVDTGIDYLSEEFRKEDGTTRILSIWDQEQEVIEPVKGLKLGVAYTEDEINRAIKLKEAGGDPYTIVPSKDEIGHGTMVAGIAAGRGINPKLKGVCPQSDIIVVKLQQISNIFKEMAGITKNDVPMYESVDIVAAIRYLIQSASDLSKPVVIILPLGTNIGGHDGTSIVEGQIDSAGKLLGTVCVTGAGNEGDTDTHTQGKFENTGEIKTIELKIGKNQKNLNFSIWCQNPDRIAIAVISPSGEVIQKIQPKINKSEEFKFVYEGTRMNVKYNYPDNATGDEIINLRFRDLKEGIWQIRLYGEYIIDGRYWSWIPQRKLLDEETKFLSPSQYSTLMIPSTSHRVLSVAYYNQNNNATVGASGRGYTRTGLVSPIIAAGGINAPIIKPNGGVGVATGSSIATAVLGGVCALILQWGIVDKNDSRLYAVTVKSYVIRGAKMREGDIYPNRQWGYGILDIERIFNAIRGEQGIRLNSRDKYDEYNIENLFIRKPNY
ncbi:MAG: S8 family peptidase [Clostridium sp.]